MSFKEELEQTNPVQISTFVINLIATGRAMEVNTHFKELFFKCAPMFRRTFFENIKNIPGIEDTISDNFELILNNISDMEVANFIEKFPQCRDEIIKNFDLIINKCRDDYLTNLIKIFHEDQRNNGIG